MDHFEEMKNLVLGLENDFNEFYGKGNKAAGRRIRKAMQDLKGKAQEVRVNVQARVKGEA